MANAFRTAIAPLVRHDGEWLRCAEPNCPAYWGAFRPTAWVAVKAQAHAAKAHGARPARPQAGRPQRRAQGADAGLLAAVDAFVAAHVGGAKRLGRGVSREVYPFGPEYVIKIAHDPTEGHNLAEAKVWASAPDWARKHLCPVLAHDPKGVWLLMRRAERVGEATWGEAKAFGRNELRDRIGDMHEQNVAWLDGHMVAIDYAGGWAARSVAW
jgi:hypothetical protein